MKLYFLLRAGLSTTKNHSSHDFVLLKCGSLQEWRLTAMLVQATLEYFMLAAIRVLQHQEWL